MLGAIRTWDIMSHPVVTIQCFGWRVFFRAVFTGQGQTFLSLLRKDSHFSVPGPDESELIQRCIELELQAKAIYDGLANRFAATMPLCAFLTELADQEQEHADLLELCQAAAGRGRRSPEGFRPWHDYVPLLESRMDEIIESLDTVVCLDDVMRLVLEIESSEINDVFTNIMRESESHFVRKLRAFRQAVRGHVAFICQQICVFSPSAMLACRELRTRYLASDPFKPAEGR
jgi:hypothetical protein